MRSMYIAASWLFGSVAVALLVLGSLAVPTQMALADTGTCEQQCASQCSAYPPGSPMYMSCYNSCMYQCTLAKLCPNSAQCSNGCNNSQPCFNAGCTNVIGCTCSNDSYSPNCSKNCKCWQPPSGIACECTDK